MTADEYLASCRATRLFTEAECQQRLAEQSVNGVFCDGNIIIDSSGHRCVPRAIIEAKIRQEVIPTTTPKGPSSVPTWALVAGGVVVAGALAWWLLAD